MTKTAAAKSSKTTATPSKTAAKTDQVNLCRCGCKEPVKSKFKQGHDQILVSQLAADVVTGSGRGLGVLAADQATADIQWRISEIAKTVSDRVSPALAAKFTRAAVRLWEIEDKRATRAADKAERDATRATEAPRKPRAKKVDSKAAEVASEIKNRPLKVVTATATNDDVDAAEAGEFAKGDKIRVLVGKRKYSATVHGMNQAGKVTAISRTVNGKEVIKTDGFTVLGN